MSIGRKCKEITWKINENGCWICTSHAPNIGGYPRVRRNGKEMILSRYTYEKYKSKIPEGLCVLHTCDVRACINPNHLFLGTKDDNNKDKMIKGRQSHYGPSLPGEMHGMAKLTEKQVIEIRAIKDISNQKIANLYNISKSQVSNIKLGISWKHLKEGVTICQ